MAYREGQSAFDQRRSHDQYHSVDRASSAGSAAGNGAAMRSSEPRSHGEPLQQQSYGGYTYQHRESPACRPAANSPTEGKIGPSFTPASAPSSGPPNGIGVTPVAVPAASAEAPSGPTEDLTRGALLFSATPNNRNHSSGSHERTYSEGGHPPHRSNSPPPYRGEEAAPRSYHHQRNAHRNLARHPYDDYHPHDEYYERHGPAQPPGLRPSPPLHRPAFSSFRTAEPDGPPVPDDARHYHGGYYPRTPSYRYSNDHYEMLPPKHSGPPPSQPVRHHQYPHYGQHPPLSHHGGVAASPVVYEGYRDHRRPFGDLTNTALPTVADKTYDSHSPPHRRDDGYGTSAGYYDEGGGAITTAVAISRTGQTKRRHPYSDYPEYGYSEDPHHPPYQHESPVSNVTSAVRHTPIVTNLESKSRPGPSPGTTEDVVQSSYASHTGPPHTARYYQETTERYAMGDTDAHRYQHGPASFRASPIYHEHDRLAPPSPDYRSGMSHHAYATPAMRRSATPPGERGRMQGPSPGGKAAATVLMGRMSSDSKHHYYHYPGSHHYNQHGEYSSLYEDAPEHVSQQPQKKRRTIKPSETSEEPDLTKPKAAAARPPRRKKMYSDFVGVTYNKTHAKFQACITHYRKQHYLGRYKLAVDAARAYDESAKLLKGNGWKINFGSTEEYERAKIREIAELEAKKVQTEAAAVANAAAESKDESDLKNEDDDFDDENDENDSIDGSATDSKIANDKDNHGNELAREDHPAIETVPIEAEAHFESSNDSDEDRHTDDTSTPACQAKSSSITPSPLKQSASKAKRNALAEVVSPVKKECIESAGDPNEKEKVSSPIESSSAFLRRDSSATLSPDRSIHTADDDSTHRERAVISPTGGTTPHNLRSDNGPNQEVSLYVSSASNAVTSSPAGKDLKDTISPEGSPGIKPSKASTSPIDKTQSPSPPVASDVQQDKKPVLQNGTLAAASALMTLIGR